MRRLLFISIGSLILFALNMCGNTPEVTTTVEAVETTSTITIASSTTTTRVTTTTAAPTVTTTQAPVITTTTAQVVTTTVAPTTLPPTTQTTTTTIPTTVVTTTQVVTTVPPATTTQVTEPTTVPTTDPATTVQTTEPTTVPETTTTTTTSTVSDEFTDIADLFSASPTEPVKVRGVVYYSIPGTMQPSYYIYDGTGYILVLDDHAVAIGDGVEFTAEYELSAQSSAPQLINVSGFEASTEFTTLPTYEEMSIADIATHLISERAFHGQPLKITGTVANMGPDYMLTFGTAKVMLNGKAFLLGNPFVSLSGQIVTINAVVHFYDSMMSAWHVLYESFDGEEPIEEDPFVAGVGGLLEERTPSEAEAGTFGGLMLFQVDRHRDPYGFVSNIVEMTFPYPDVFEATSYTLQYYDVNDSTWKNYQYNDEDLTMIYDSFSLSMYESLTLRLIINDGPNQGYTSNEQSYVLPIMKCDFTGYGVDMSINEEGIMMPYVGFTLKASFSAINFEGETDVDVSDTLIYKWYRVDPVTYEEILIASATGQTEYDTTMDDAGYYIMVRAEGDQINSSGFYQVIIEWIVTAGNPGFITDESASGFTINLFYEAAGLDPEFFEIFDQDWNNVQVLSVVQGDNPAIYHVTIDDSTITNNYSFTYNTGFWAMQFDMGMGGEFHHYSEMGYVELIPIE